MLVNVCRQKKTKQYYNLPKCPKLLYGFCLDDVKKKPAVKSCKNVHLTTNGKIKNSKPKSKKKKS